MSAERLTILTGPTEVPLEGLLDKKVSLLGYGNQGRSHALNLRDSGIDISISTRNTNKAPLSILWANG